MTNKIKASCTWGEGPDVIITLDGKPLILYEDPKNESPPKGHWKHGFVTKGSMDFTITEAEDLAEQLMRAVKQARGLEESYAQYPERPFSPF